MSPHKTLLYRKDGRIARITLKRPRRRITLKRPRQRNAINAAPPVISNFDNSENEVAPALQTDAIARFDNQAGWIAGAGGLSRD